MNANVPTPAPSAPDEVEKTPDFATLTAKLLRSAFFYGQRNALMSGPLVEAAHREVNDANDALDAAIQAQAAALRAQQKRVLELERFLDHLHGYAGHTLQCGVNASPVAQDCSCGLYELVAADLAAREGKDGSVR